MAEQKDMKIINEIVNDAFWLSFILYRKGGHPHHQDREEYIRFR